MPRRRSTPAEFLAANPGLEAAFTATSHPIVCSAGSPRCYPNQTQATKTAAAEAVKIQARDRSGAVLAEREALAYDDDDAQAQADELAARWLGATGHVLWQPTS